MNPSDIFGLIMVIGTAYMMKGLLVAGVHVAAGVLASENVTRQKCHPATAAKYRVAF